MKNSRNSLGFGYLAVLHNLIPKLFHVLVLAEIIYDNGIDVKQNILKDTKLSVIILTQA